MAKSSMAEVQHSYFFLFILLLECQCVLISTETLKYGLIECCNMKVFFFPYTHIGVRDHFTQANEPIAGLCCYKGEQFPFYQNDNCNTGKKAVEWSWRETRNSRFWRDSSLHGWHGSWLNRREDLRQHCHMWNAWIVSTFSTGGEKKYSWNVDLAPDKT